MPVSFAVTLLFLFIGSCSADNEVAQNSTSEDEGKIVGGRPVHIWDYPHQVALEYRGSFRCGGSILSPTTVLTAAHCIVNVEVKELKVRTGTSHNEVGGTVHSVTSVTRHPKFDLNTIDYDVGVITLKHPLTFTHEIQSVKLTTVEAEPNTLATVTGWGLLEENGNVAKQLQAVDVPLISHSRCQNDYPSSAITKRMICAGFQEGGRGPCQGDSGGPLLNPSKKQIGIVSWGIGCARPRGPAVYTKIGNEEILDFILAHIH